MRRVGRLTFAMALACMIPGPFSSGVAAVAEQQGVTVTAPARTTAVPDPQLRYRNGPTGSARAASPVANDDAVPRPTQERSLRSMMDRLSSYLPNFLAGVLVLVVGTLIAYLVRSVVLRWLPQTGLDRFLERHGLISRPSISNPTPDFAAEPSGEAPTSTRSTPDTGSGSYESYFGRPPARRWNPGDFAFHEPEENARNLSPLEEDPKAPKPGSEPDEDVFEQRLSGSPLAESGPIYEQKTDRFIEEQYSFDAADAEDHANVFADAKKFLEQEGRAPNRPLHYDMPQVEEQPVPRPPLRRAADLYHPGTGTQAVAHTAFWIVAIATLMEACQAAHLYAFAEGLNDVLSYIPHLIAAVVIFIISILVAAWVRERVVGTGSGATSLVGGAVRAGILTIGGFMALRELQIAPDIVKIAFTLAFGAIALASGLAFGLGSRKVAEQVTSEIYDQNSSKVKEFGRRLGRDDRAA